MGETLAVTLGVSLNMFMLFTQVLEKIVLPWWPRRIEFGEFGEFWYA